MAKGSVLDRPAARPATIGDGVGVLALLRANAGLELAFEASEFRVVVQGGQVVACGRLRRHADGALELASVATDAAHRGRGLASQVTEALLNGVRMPVYALALAPGFFAQHGFVHTDAAMLPASVRTKAEGMCATQPFEAMVRPAVA